MTNSLMTVRWRRQALRPWRSCPFVLEWWHGEAIDKVHHSQQSVPNQPWHREVQTIEPERHRAEQAWLVVQRRPCNRLFGRAWAIRRRIGAWHWPIQEHSPQHLQRAPVKRNQQTLPTEWKLYKHTHIESKRGQSALLIIYYYSTYIHLGYVRSKSPPCRCFHPCP